MCVSVMVCNAVLFNGCIEVFVFVVPLLFRQRVKQLHGASPCVSPTRILQAQPLPPAEKQHPDQVVHRPGLLRSRLLLSNG